MAMTDFALAYVRAAASSALRGNPHSPSISGQVVARTMISNASRLRQAGCRGSNPHRTHEPLHIAQHARDRPHALKISGKGTPPASALIAQQSPRRLVTIANAILKTGIPWQTQPDR